MPVICELFGAKICMYYKDHVPPHVHVLGAGFSAVVSIPEGTVVAGELPPGIRSRVAEWVRRNTKALQNNWERAQKGRPLLRVPAE